MSLSKHALERLRKEQRRIQGDLKRITVLDGSPGGDIIEYRGYLSLSAGGCSGHLRGSYSLMGYEWY